MFKRKKKENAGAAGMRPETDPYAGLSKKEAKEKKKRDKAAKKELKKQKRHEKKESERIKHTVIESTQANIPVKEFVDGVIVTTDKRYIKIIEVIPTPFFMKSPEDQNDIYLKFKAMFRSAPVHIQFKSIAVPTDISAQLNTLRQHKKSETNPDVIQFYDDYEARLYASQYNSIMHRYFIIFAYEPDAGSAIARAAGSRRSELDRAMDQLDATAKRMASRIMACGNKVRMLTDNRETAEVFYTILNRDKAANETYAEHLSRILEKYNSYYMSETGQPRNYFMPAPESIAPDRIDFSNKNYLIVNGTYYKFMFIQSDGYPPYIVPGWMNLLVDNGPGVDVDIFLDRVPREQIMPRLKRTIGHATADLNQNGSNTDSFESASNSLQSAQYLRNQLLSRDDVYDMSVIVTISADNPADVEENVIRIKKEMAEHTTAMVPLEMENEQAFLSVLPLCNLDKFIRMRTKQNIATETAGALYPFTTASMTADDGIYVGDAMGTGEMVIVDYFDRSKFTNPNIFIAGTSGAGKTFTLLLQAIRFRVSRIPIMIIAPEKENEFRRLCTAIGGEFIQIAKGSPDRINPMEIFMKDPTAVQNQELIDGTVSNISDMAEKATQLVRLFKLLSPDMSKTDEQTLDQLIAATYADFGITTDSNSLWADDAHTKYKKMPVFSDLARKAKEMGITSTTITSTLDYLTKGSASSFDGPTNVNTNSDFIVFGLEHNDAEMLPVAIFLAMDFAWSKIKEDRTKKKFLMIDEWWKMAFNPIAADYSMEISKTIRAYSGGILFATQQMSDVLQAGSQGKAVIGNCATKILMKMGKDDIPAVAEVADLSEDERKSMINFNPGDALMLADVNRVMLHFVASENERLLCSTDAKTIREYARIKAERNAKKAVSDADTDDAADIADYFDDDFERHLSEKYDETDDLIG